MGKPSAPTPPNPIDTARAATSTNVSTAVANAFLNNTNQTTPDGSLSYDQTSTYDFTDPTTGSTYTIPRFTATQALSPRGQQLKDTQDQTKLNLGTVAKDQSGRIGSILGNPFNPNGGPQAGDSATISNIPKALTSFNSGGVPIQTSLASSDPITTDYGPADNYSADRQRVEDSLMSRMNPQLQQQHAALEQRLSDQGIRYGSKAYNDAMFTDSQGQNDARWGAISQAGQEQQRMNEMEAQRAAFQNNAQQQGYTQNLGDASFGNQAEGQLFQQNASGAQFTNAGLAQQQSQASAGFNASEAARNQWLQEQYANRNQPINETTALMAGSQVNQPNFVNSPSTQIPTTDTAGLINNNFAQQQQNYQQANTNYNSTIGGILGLGAGALKLSDEREKKDIDRMGTVFSATENGDKALPIYEYSYKSDPASTRHIGPMAQDVEKLDKRSVVNSGGRKFIDTHRVMGNILRAG